MTDAPERIWAYPWTGKTNEGQWQTFEAVGSTLFIRADLSPSPEVVKELVEALRAFLDDSDCHESGAWFEGRLSRARAALAKLEGGE